MNITIPTKDKEKQSPEALDAVKYKYVLDTERVILVQANMDRDDGCVTLIQAMPRVLEKFPDAQLIVIGCGYALPDMLSETHKLGIREQTVFPGEVSEEDLTGLYKCCTVLVTTAVRNDGQETYGKPATNIEPGQPAKVADALITILSDPSSVQK